MTIRRVVRCSGGATVFFATDTLLHAAWTVPIRIRKGTSPSQRSLVGKTTGATIVVPFRPGSAAVILTTVKDETLALTESGGTAVGRVLSTDYRDRPHQAKQYKHSEHYCHGWDGSTRRGKGTPHRHCCCCCRRSLCRRSLCRRSLGPWSLVLVLLLFPFGVPSHFFVSVTRETTR